MMQEYDLTEILPKEKLEKIDEAIDSGDDKKPYEEAGCNNLKSTPLIDPFKCNNCKFFYVKDRRRFDTSSCRVEDYINKRKFRTIELTT